MIVQASQWLAHHPVNMDSESDAHCAKSTAGVKLCPSLKTSGIRSYQLRYCVYIFNRSLAASGLPGECRMYKD